MKTSGCIFCIIARFLTACFINDNSQQTSKLINQVRSRLLKPLQPLEIKAWKYRMNSFEYYDQFDWYKENLVLSRLTLSRN